MSSESATNGVHYNHNKRDLITQILTNDGSKDDFKKVVNKVLKELLFYFTELIAFKGLKDWRQISSYDFETWRHQKPQYLESKKTNNIHSIVVVVVVVVLPISFLYY